MGQPVSILFCLGRGGTRIPTQHYGISPELLSLLTGKPVSSLPDHITPSVLPSRYAAMAYGKSRQFDRDLPENYATLTCPSCGKRGKYDVGAVFVDARSHDPMAGIQLTGYFRCKHCNGAGDWELPPELLLRSMATLIGAAAGGQDQDGPVMFGRTCLYDGFEGRFATDSESHLLGQLRESPSDGWLWNRLGNFYKSAGRPDLALVAFEQAIRLDESQVESQFSIGLLLSVLGHTREAGHHLRMALARARDYDQMDLLKLRDIVSIAVRELTDMSYRTRREIPVFPTPEEYGEQRYTSMVERTPVMQLKTFDLDMDDLTTFYPIAEVFVGPDRLTGALARKERANRREMAGTPGLPSRASRQIRRNEPCPCGSGKKYKKCCGRLT